MSIIELLKAAKFGKKDMSDDKHFIVFYRSKHYPMLLVVQNDVGFYVVAKHPGFNSKIRYDLTKDAHELAKNIEHAREISEL